MLQQISDTYSTTTLYYFAANFHLNVICALQFFQQQNIQFSILSMISPNSSRRQSPVTSRRPSPRAHLITLQTDRTAPSSPWKGGFAQPNLLDPSPTQRNRTKIRLVSPLKHQKALPSPSKIHNLPQRVETDSPRQNPPQRNIADIELGGKVGRQGKRKLNDISNISIKEHLRPNKQTSPSKPVPHKYSAFIIMPPEQKATMQQAQVSPFKKQTGPFITINNKPFDVSSLQSHVIHVSPFRHVNPCPWSPSPTIREETENSTLKESCDSQLREIKEMRREMEAESSRIRESLKSSKVNQNVCVSRLVFADSQARTHSRHPSKLLNFQDMPLHQSRIKTEERLSVPHVKCEIEESLITKEIKCHPFEEAPEIQTNKQAKPESEMAGNSEAPHLQAPTIKETCAPSQKTIINELNFLTSKKLGCRGTVEAIEEVKFELVKQKEEVCVQTDRAVEEQKEGEKSRKLAIWINEECKVIVEATKITKQDLQSNQGYHPQQEQHLIIEVEQREHTQQEYQEEKAQIGLKSQEVPVSQKQKFVQKQEILKEQQAEEKPYVLPEAKEAVISAALIPSAEIIPQLPQNHQQTLPSACIPDSNLSLELQNHQPAHHSVKQVEKESSKNSQSSFQLADTANHQRILFKRKETDGLSLRSMPSPHTPASSLHLASKRSINNRAYL